METKNLLKSNASGNRNLIKNPVVKALKESNAIIEAANQFYQNRKAEIETEAREIYRRAKLEAREAALLELEENLVRAREVREEALTRVESEILKLSLTIAKKIIGREIKQNEETVLEIISNALQNVRQQEKITIRISPDNFDFVNSNRAKLNQTGRIKYLDFVADSKVKTEGCIIESEIGTVDARLETQLGILERLLLNQP